MHTIVQNDEGDYDIDVGIVFESSNLNGLGSLASRNMVAGALKRKTKQFAEEPEVKTSCVRLKYTSTGYHVDFAIFKREKDTVDDKKYTYEHAGAEWSARDVKALEEWFNAQIKEKGDILRKVIRLSKMFCKSRDTWKNMPSGLLQTVLCDENLCTDYSRIDEVFYYTMQAIVNRISDSTEVVAPVDDGRTLVVRDIDRQRMNNWKSRLASKLKELLFADIIEVQLSDRQEQLFRELSRVKSDKYRFATADEIKALGVKYNTNDMSDNIGNHTFKVLNENSDKLTMTNDYKEIISINL